ncbi:MAG: hypothetical protein BECKG1743D_GA0114223_102261 [Candidatus Kentron sp. G]|nr:MAG: hypothetical protein BECKG1743D_GA0114223_102261 [Candidatus Kentron sp. G]
MILRADYLSCLRKRLELQVVLDKCYWKLRLPWMILRTMMLSAPVSTQVQNTAVESIPIFRPRAAGQGNRMIIFEGNRL